MLILMIRQKYFCNNPLLILSLGVEHISHRQMEAMSKSEITLSSRSSYDVYMGIVY